MGVYAILDEYDADKAGIHVQAVILVNGHREPPVRTFVYKSSDSREMILKGIYDFLEKEIEKNYTVYVGEGYNTQYQKILNNLKHRFITKDIMTLPATLPESKREDLGRHIERMGVEATKKAQDYLEWIVKKAAKRA